MGYKDRRKGITIVLSGVETINELLGNSEEARITVKNAIIQEFAHRYLKAIVPELQPIIRSVMYEVSEKEIEGMIKKEFASSSSIQRLIGSKVGKLIDNEFEKKVNEEIIRRINLLVNTHNGG